MVLPLFLVDLAFFAANVPKIPHGGWLPLVIGLGLVIQMTTWRRGRAIVAQVLERGQRRTEDVMDAAVADGVVTVPGTAIYMFKDPGFAPPALISNLRHNHVRHDTTVILSVITSSSPRIPHDRVAATSVLPGVYRVVITFGYMDEHDVVAELRRLRLDGAALDIDERRSSSDGRPCRRSPKARCHGGVKSSSSCSIAAQRARRASTTCRRSRSSRSARKSRSDPTRAMSQTMDAEVAWEEIERCGRERRIGRGCHGPPWTYGGGMPPLLGELVGQGVTSEVYTWPAGMVVKLFRSGGASTACYDVGTLQLALSR